VTETPREWLPEIVVAESTARRLVEEQFPELRPRRFRLLGEGWDNTVWLVDDAWVFRFPRRELSVSGVGRQVELLPRLAAELPIPIPEPTFSGRPSADLPWPFFGCEVLPGQEVAHAGLPTGTAARGVARGLGDFLGVLHSLDVENGSSLPVDPFRRSDMAFRAGRTRERLRELDVAGIWRGPSSIGPLLEEAEALPSATGLVIAHGDLHLRHLLVDGDGQPSAVIDWDDLCLADPAVDLVLFWCLIPPDARPDFLAAYGAVDHATLVRARVLALFVCATLALYGQYERRVALERTALAGLDRTLAA
jgi:aminoglycoside phosphotransferase (APT) family kinase protein